jgi:hypothetical protein
MPLKTRLLKEITPPHLRKPLTAREKYHQRNLGRAFAEWIDLQHPPQDVDATALTAMMSATDIAKAINQPRSRVEKFLRDLRINLRDCYVRNHTKRKNEASILYRVADVLPHLQKKLPAWRLLDA